MASGGNSTPQPRNAQRKTHLVVRSSMELRGRSPPELDAAQFEVPNDRLGEDLRVVQLPLVRTQVEAPRDREGDSPNELGARERLHAGIIGRNNLRTRTM